MAISSLEGDWSKQSGRYIHQQMQKFKSKNQHCPKISSEYLHDSVPSPLIPRTDVTSHKATEQHTGWSTASPSMFCDSTSLPKRYVRGSWPSSSKAYQNWKHTTLTSFNLSTRTCFTPTLSFCRFSNSLRRSATFNSDKDKPSIAKNNKMEGSLTKTKALPNLSRGLQAYPQYKWNTSSIICENSGCVANRLCSVSIFLPRDPWISSVTCSHDRFMVQ